MRKPIIVGNWKMNKTCAEAVSFINEIEPKLHDGADYGIAAPFTALKDCVNTAKNLLVAAENCHFEDNGAFTGEVSVPMLEEIGVKWCIIGHSERRQMFNETDETVNKKVLSALAHNLKPIVCVGETLEQRDAGIMQSWVEGQIEKALAGLTAEEMLHVVIAYEPIWAIGTGRTATAAQAEEVCAIIRHKIAALYDAATADAVSILYGGSVKGKNVAELTASPDIDGGLVGGASLKAPDFLEIIQNAVVK